MGSNTKPYLLSLLLLFLLAHTSVAGPFSTNILNKLGKYLDDWAEYVKKSPDPLEKIIDYNKNHNPPPTTLPPTASQGINKLVKEHLNNYGYLSDADSVTNAQFISSIQDYQKFFNLEVTDSLDMPTLKHMSLPRCIVPDKNLTYDFSTANLSWPLGTQWFPNGRRNLTYGFAQADEIRRKVPIITKLFADSFKRWSDTIKGVNLTETKYEDADIKIEFVLFKDIDAERTEVVGGTYIRLLSGKGSRTNVTYGDMFLDVSKNTVRQQKGKVDLESVVMHQIGHLLGLQHSSHEDSVMYPSFDPEKQIKRVNLTDDDKEQINQVYSSTTTASSSTGSVRGNVTNLAAVSNLAGSFWGLVATTLSLGLACLVLFY